MQHNLRNQLYVWAPKSCDFHHDREKAIPFNSFRAKGLPVLPVRSAHCHCEAFSQELRAFVVQRMRPSRQTRSIITLLEFR